MGMSEEPVVANVARSPTSPIKAYPPIIKTPKILVSVRSISVFDSAISALILAFMSLFGYRVIPGEEKGNKKKPEISNVIKPVNHKP